jgi:hypothetical protein
VALQANYFKFHFFRVGTRLRVSAESPLYSILNG